MEYYNPTLCVVCGELADIKQGLCIYTGEHRCDSPTCQSKASDYRLMRDKLLRRYVEEKNVVLRPILERLNDELDLLVAEKLHYKPLWDKIREE